MVFRLEPVRPVQLMQTYGLSAPQATHYRLATCREVGCANYANGWISGFDVTDSDQARACRIVREQSGRLFTVQEIIGASGRVERVLLTFGPGQECFLPHRVALEREPIYYSRDGDFRGNPTGRKIVFGDSTSFVDDFGEHQEKIKTLVERG
jgi:hypothetical protein